MADTATTRTSAEAQIEAMANIEYGLEWQGYVLQKEYADNQKGLSDEQMAALVSQVQEFCETYEQGITHLKRRDVGERTSSFATGKIITGS